MNGECHHIGLFSFNPDKLIVFYTEKMGFELLGVRDISQDWMSRIFGYPSACQLTKLGFGSAILEIFSPRTKSEEPESGPLPSRGYNHWAMGVADKEMYVRELEKNGVPMLKLEGTGRFIFFVKDPEGNLIEIYQKKEGA
jgi:catechol 2,3-dioxygenase-like lactoylglutathione lyase family enzyme